jgi:HSP20 family molecular chaperone IbpA
MVVRIASEALRSKEIFRAIELPAEVDPSQATATLEDGVLNISVPKTVARKAAHA